MAPLTWRNVAAPDFSSAARMIEQASQGFGSAFGGMGESFRKQGAVNRRNASAEMFPVMAGVSDTASAEAALGKISQMQSHNMSPELLEAMMGLKETGQQFEIRDQQMRLREEANRRAQASASASRRQAQATAQRKAQRDEANRELMRLGAQDRAGALTGDDHSGNVVFNNPTGADMPGPTMEAAAALSDAEAAGSATNPAAYLDPRGPSTRAPYDQSNSYGGMVEYLRENPNADPKIAMDIMDRSFNAMTSSFEHEQKIYGHGRTKITDQRADVEHERREETREITQDADNYVSRNVQRFRDVDDFVRDTMAKDVSAEVKAERIASLRRFQEQNPGYYTVPGASSTDSPSATSIIRDQFDAEISVENLTNPDMRAGQSLLDASRGGVGSEESGNSNGAGSRAVASGGSMQEILSTIMGDENVDLGNSSSDFFDLVQSAASDSGMDVREIAALVGDALSGRAFGSGKVYLNKDKLAELIDTRANPQRALQNVDSALAREMYANQFEALNNEYKTVSEQKRWLLRNGIPENDSQIEALDRRLEEINQHANALAKSRPTASMRGSEPLPDASQLPAAMAIARAAGADSSGSNESPNILPSSRDDRPAPSSGRPTGMVQQPDGRLDMVYDDDAPAPSAPQTASRQDVRGGRSFSADRPEGVNLPEMTMADWRILQDSRQADPSDASMQRAGNITEKVDEYFSELDSFGRRKRFMDQLATTVGGNAATAAGATASFFGGTETGARLFDIGDKVLERRDQVSAQRNATSPAEAALETKAVQFHEEIAEWYKSEEAQEFFKKRPDLVARAESDPVGFFMELVEKQ